MTIDLASLDTATACETPFDIELKHPKTEAPLGIFVQVIGYNSGPLRALADKKRDKERERAFALQMGQKVEPQPRDEEDAEGRDSLVAATVGWYERERGKDGKLGKRQEGVQFGNTRLTFSKDEAAKLYSNPGFGWLGVQIVKAVYDIGNFIKA